MRADDAGFELLAHEARALLSRLVTARPFALQTPMVMAAAPSSRAQVLIESHMARRRDELDRLIARFLAGLAAARARGMTLDAAQQRFAFLRLRFNAMLTQFDIFSDAISQRSEHHTGIWLAGLDALADDALRLPGTGIATPPTICYLDRGHGAAIRRARTRLPGGQENPVAIIRVPRERMIGSGIASSLIHEVGHQGAALLDLVESLGPVLAGLEQNGGASAVAWRIWRRWTSEIVADLWSVAKVGVAATLGLISVVSLPRVFVFRLALDDPHPAPWLRVKLSCALGAALFPHPQWHALARLWESLYPPDGIDHGRRAILALLERTMPGLVALLVNHRPRALRGRSVAEAIVAPGRSPRQLATLWSAWRGEPARMRRAAPTLVFAVIGQAKADRAISAAAESRILTDMLTHWALAGALGNSARCAVAASQLDERQPRRLTWP